MFHLNLKPSMKSKYFRLNHYLASVIFRSLRQSHSLTDSHAPPSHGGHCESSRIDETCFFRRKNSQIPFKSNLLVEGA